MSNLGLNTVIMVPGGMSAPPDGKYHILHYGKGGPFLQMCNDVDGWKYRHAEITAPVRLWCEACLKTYRQQLARTHRQLHVVGTDTGDGYIVAYGPSFGKAQVVEYIRHESGVKDRPGVALGLEWVARFGAEFTHLAASYGYDARYVPDFVEDEDESYWPRGVVICDKPDYLFQWKRLAYVAADNIAMALKAYRYATRLERWRRSLRTCD